MKVIALYLPQYHPIKENNEWWGEGYTEWTALRKGQVYVDGQYQPRIPKDNKYYNLLDIDVMKWQADIAKENGVYGFCFYHYWFNGHLLLEKPLEQFLKHKEIEFPYFFCWANERWTRVWEGEAFPKVLIEHDYYDKNDVDKHFYYMLPFFMDDRYMKVDNKPLFNIYNPIAMPPHCLKYMVNRWNKLAKKEGFSGISFSYLCAESMCYMSEIHRKYFDYGIEYEPSYAQHIEDDAKAGRMHYYKSYFAHAVAKTFPWIKKYFVHKKCNYNTEIIDGVKTIRSYDDDWNTALNVKHDDYSKYVPGAFVDWDNTPRRGRAGKLILGATPEKFEMYFNKLIKRTKKLYKTDMIVVFAWNEWSEGGYLEPDEKYGDAYLKAIKHALIDNDEFEVWKRKS
jgi:hypothetical protein